MESQLIVNILGTSALVALSNITACISKGNCNILDSRHAQYGTDFSLTMIVSGSQSAITRLEMELSTLCVNDDLLCLMKRTSGHKKQNIEQIINLSFNGVDASGVMNNVIHALTPFEVHVSALRQKTYKQHGETIVDCKMILTTPKTTDLSVFDTHIKSVLNEMNLHGKISHNPIEENNEYTESW